MKFVLSLFLFFATFNYAYSDDINTKMMAVLEDWNKANNAKDIDMLAKLYASKVTYYGSKFPRNKCIKDKKRIFKKYPNFSQTIKNVSYTPITASLYKVSFEKHVQIDSGKKSKMYPSYLVVDTLSSSYEIIEEGDSVTDKNLKIKNQSAKTFTFEGKYEISGTIEKVKYYGPPGYGETPQEDAQLTAYIMKLNQPITVTNNNSEPDTINSTTTASEVQLATFDFGQQLDDAEKKHKEITIKGEFFSAHTGYHIRDLLMDVKSINGLEQETNENDTIVLSSEYSKERPVRINAEASGKQSEIVAPIDLDKSKANTTNEVENVGESTPKTKEKNNTGFLSVVLGAFMIWINLALALIIGLLKWISSGSFPRGILSALIWWALLTVGGYVLIGFGLFG